MNHDAVAEFSRVIAMNMPATTDVLPPWLMPWGGMDPETGALSRRVPWATITEHCASPETVVAWLGSPHSRGHASEGDATWEYVRYIMPSWPHLYVSFRFSNGVIWWWRFETIERVDVPLPLRGDVVRAGIWTENSLLPLASEVRTLDAWDFWTHLRLQLADDVYTAHFSSGLLVSWTRL